MLSNLKISPALTIWTAFLILVIPILTAVSRADSFSISGQGEMALSGEALDMAVSNDGRWTFILTKNGEVEIYDISGDRVQVLKVEKGFDNIEYNPAGNRLMLSAWGKKEVKVLTLSMIYEIDYEGSPFRGPVDAPVTIAVFDDFQ